MKKKKKKKIQNCMICKKLHGSALQQKMSDLPPERCTPGKPPFTFVGVDIFGPFYVKQGRSGVKRYGCLYTCFNTRAIHLEVLNSLEADLFINGFIRFTARRGYPKKIWSNNGTNLVGAQAELSRSLQDKVISAARRKEVDWIFNTPQASHHGGVWERMIRTVRKVFLPIMLKVGKVTDEVLSTIICEVEGNSRSITKVSDDVNDNLALTPNLLLLMRDNSPFTIVCC